LFILWKVSTLVSENDLFECTSKCPLQNTIHTARNISNVCTTVSRVKRLNHRTLFSFMCCPIMCRYVPSSVLWYPLGFPHKNDFWFVYYLQLFVGWRMSYLHYLCLLTYSSIQHILRCVFALFFVVLCTLCCQFFWDCPFFIVPSVLSNVYLQHSDLHVVP